MDIAMKEQQWWIEHDVNLSLSCCLGASLLKEVGETKLQEMPGRLCTGNFQLVTTKLFML
jgi:hypothetical protein